VQQGKPGRKEAPERAVGLSCSHDGAASLRDLVIPCPALTTLRTRTAHAHRTLEATLEIAAPDVGKAEYARYVAAMWGWMRGVEDALWSGPWPGSVQPGRRAVKALWLEHDVAAARADGLLCESLPECHDVTADRCPAARFGQAYVIEGSMLGGAFLMQRIGARLAPWALRYLQGYRDDGGELWRGFLQALSVHVRAADEIEAAAAAAEQTFASIGGWLRARGVA
jgi:heme oxygenase